MQIIMKYLVWAMSISHVLCSSAHSGQIYKWVDEKGYTRFTTRYDSIPEQYKNQVSAPPERTEHRSNNGNGVGSLFPEVTSSLYDS